MICDGCHEDRTVTVLHTAVISVIDGRSGRETPRTLGRRLCVACGGADSSQAAEPEPAVTMASVRPQRKTAQGRRR